MCREAPAAHDRGAGPGRRDVLAGLGAGGLALLTGGLGRPAYAAAVGAGPLTAEPVIRPRADWAGDACPATGPLPVEAPGDVRFLLVHHTAEPGNDYSAADVPRLMRGMYAFHAGPEKGWSDLAYNFVVDRYGGIWEGRTGSLTAPVIPAATGGTQGFDQLGCFLGDHATVPPTEQAQAAMISLLAWLARRYAVDPTPGRTVSFVSRGSNRWPAGTPVTTRTIEGHRAMSLTTCPGDAAYPLVLDVFPAAVTALLASSTPIEQHYLALGGATSFLGAAVSRQLTSRDGVGRHVEYAGGSIYWSPDTGAHEVHGLIRTAWRDGGAERSALGYPVSDEVGTPDGLGRFSVFQGGSVYWSPASGAHEVHGEILATWAALGWETGVLGYPVSDERPSADGHGRHSRFQGGSIHWSPGTGAHEVHGEIRDAWVRVGGERSWLGYPTSNEYAVPTGRASDFQGGRATWDAGTGAVTLTR